jgi:hypothetical protein
VAGVGDLDQDGRPEFAVSAIGGSSKGVLRIYSAGWPMPPSTYCTAKVNSQGCAPTLAAQGTPTLTGQDDFVVTAIDVINNKQGVFLWGLGAAKVSAFGSVLCIAPPMIRTGLLPSGGNPGGDDCSGALSFHFSHTYLSQNGLTPGADVHVQAWYRDPALPFNAAGLSNAMTFFVAP